jgi:hypothetical protein
VNSPGCEIVGDQTHHTEIRLGYNGIALATGATAIGADVGLAAKVSSNGVSRSVIRCLLMMVVQSVFKMV